MSIIAVYERREAGGLNAHVPLILRGDALYDPDLDRFFLDLAYFARVGRRFRAISGGD
ncbi:MAG: hypothetical protein H9533_08170, partial [Rhodobacteraceae bacterium]|nr:hypothetical protein [Paracoccaceae bacterium]